jgi:naphthoate synthase
MRNWVALKSYNDIKFEFFEGIAKITINRPRVYNAFRPETNIENETTLAW